jgi:hypothetical protein
MEQITFYPTEPCNIQVAFETDEGTASNPLTPYNKDYSDIEEVMVSFKKKVTDFDDAYLRLFMYDGQGGDTQSGSITIDEANHTITIQKLESDELPVGTYSIYIGVKCSGLTNYLWLRTQETQNIIVEDDGIRL